MNCEILAIGSEMLTPFRQDTNFLYLTSRLNALGVNVIAKSVIGDRRALISSAVASSLPRTDIIVLTGGLGPTKDDLTREAVADGAELGEGGCDHAGGEEHALFQRQQFVGNAGGGRVESIVAAAVFGSQCTSHVQNPFLPDRSML